jgi:drug/metabolite transporter (DMT)-like permease
VIPSSTWGWVGLSIIVATSLRYAIQTKGQQGTSAANAAVIMILEPIWVFLISIIWFAETMSLYKIIGCSLILFSILINRGMGQFVPFYLQKYKSRFIAKTR